jgi:hypothetical protein
MAKKKTTAVKKAAKTPTVKVLKAEVSTLTREETSYKHAEATARTAASRKHDAAEVSSIGKKITSLKHTIASKSSRKTGLALDPDDVQCCAAQALAASLHLASGAIVHDEDMLALYRRTAGDPGEGASVLDTLKAAREYGLSGLRSRFRSLDFAAIGAEALGADVAAVEVGLADVKRPLAVAVLADAVEGDALKLGSGSLSHPLILKLDLPEGPHAVTVAPDGAWWSWGEPYDPADFGGAAVTEAWAVSWS